MKLVERSVARPTAAISFALLLIGLGLVSLTRLPVREYPDVDPPIVSVTVVHPGASAKVVERDVTDPIEARLGGIEDVERITSVSRDGFSQIDVEFALGRDLDAAAAEVRDRVSASRRDLPEEIEEPTIAKASADSQAMIWVTLTSDALDRRALTDVAVRELVDPLSIVPGVARVLIGGERRYAVRVWLDREAMAGRGVTALDVRRVLEAENVELPGGRIETGGRELSVRVRTKLARLDDFRALVVRETGGRQIRLGEVARIELGAESDRSAVYWNGEPAVGLGIVRQSGANTLAVARAVRAELARLEQVVPAGIQLRISYDQSVFIEGSIREVIETLLITVAIVLAVIFLFLGSLRATWVPALVIPASVVGSFAALLAVGASVNTLTLLALVLGIGLVVDDAIVVLESAVQKRESGEPRLAAAVLGGREVGAAVVATTAVLVAVLLPITAASGTVGRLFAEFAFALSAALVGSSILALTLGSFLASRVAEPARDAAERAVPMRWIARGLDRLERGYSARVESLVTGRATAVALALCLAAAIGGVLLFQSLPRELAPSEDRGNFIVPIEGPRGSTLEQTTAVVDRIRRILPPPRSEAPESPLEQTIGIVGLARVGPSKVNEALMIVRLAPWEERGESQQALVERLLPEIVSLPGAAAVPINPVGLVPDAFGKPIQLVLSGGDYEEAYQWAQTLVAEARGAGFVRDLQIDFDRRRPQVQVDVDQRLAADLGLSAADIGRTLQIFLGGDEITDVYRRGETYEVVVRGESADRDDVGDLGSVYVRSDTGALVPLASVVRTELVGTASRYRRVDREPAVVIEGIPAAGRSLGEVLAALRQQADEIVPETARISTLGLSKELEDSSRDFLVVLGLGLMVVYLVLASLFGSFLQPLAIFVAIPAAAFGGLALAAVFGVGLNVFSQIGLLLVVGLLAKNAVLLVDAANRRRRAGEDLDAATVGAARARFRPILMTSISTFFGAVPLALADGPGAEARTVLGVVVLAGIALATTITLLLVPPLYRGVARLASEPGRARERLEQELGEGADGGAEGAAATGAS